MHFSSEPSRRQFQKSATLLGILFMHVALLWMFKLGGNQRQIQAVQYLTLFNLAPVKELTKKSDKSPLPIPKLEHKVVFAKVRTPEAISNVQKIDLDSVIPSIPNTEVNFKLNLDMLRGQAVQIERTRVKLDIEKMNDSRKLNLSIEATFDRELNKIKLPDCHSMLLGKLMPERMLIIQNHSKKKFCG